MVLLSSCSKFAELNTPNKTAMSSHTALAAHAESQFWQTLHAGQYQKIPQTQLLLTAAYIQNPYDPELAAHLGFLHIWQIAERQRLAYSDPNIVNHIILARKYFADAVVLNPADPRPLGFLGDSELVEGKIFKDERLQVRGYFRLKQAIRAWPQFNYFSAGYPMSILPIDSKNFRKGLTWQWRTLDVCAGQKVNRTNPSFVPYLYRETTIGKDRACWNSWIAPYNFEGFFLNMGDMLVKAGDPATAIKIYDNAKLAKNYSSWPYRKILLARIANVYHNQANFIATSEIYNQNKNPNQTIAFNSRFSCMMCHQESP